MDLFAWNRLLENVFADQFPTDSHVHFNLESGFENFMECCNLPPVLAYRQLFLNCCSLDLRRQQQRIPQSPPDYLVAEIHF